MAQFFINRPIVAMVIAILITIAGLVAMSRLPIAQLPDIVPPQVQVTTTYTGADAVAVEQAVATSIEQQVNGVDNMLYMKSTSANDGTLMLSADFEVGTNVDIDNVLVQNRVAQATPSLPAEIKNFGVTVKKSLAFPLLIISFISPNGTYDFNFLGNYATINVIDAIRRIPGVGDVQTRGTSDYAMRIWVKPDQIAKLGLTVTDLQNAIQKQNAVNPAGQVGGEPAPQGQEFTYAVRAQGRLVTAAEFGNIVVRLNPDGSTIRLKDIARIELGTQNYNQRGRLSGKTAAVVSVNQLPGANALAVANQVKKTLEELKTRFPPDLDYEVSLDTTLPITQGIKEIVKTLVAAVVLVTLVVYLFLQSWRATLIPLLTVPVSLIGTFMVFPLLGFTINTLSLFGLVLAIGLVVDDAIVVVEAVQHNIEQGLSPRNATLKAMSEVSGPVIAIALVLSTVFIPVAFMAGITGRLYQQFALTIAISVVISAFNALSLSPALSAKLLRPAAKARGPRGWFFAGFNRWFNRASNGYVSLAGILVRRTIVSVLFLVVIAAVAGQLGKILPGGFLPDEDNGYMVVSLQLPDAASFQRTDAVVRKLGEIVGKTPGVLGYNAITGFSMLTGSSTSYSATIFVRLLPWDKRTTPETSVKGIQAAINRQLAQLPEGRAFAILPPAIPGFGRAGGFSMMLQDRSGGSVEFLAEQVNRFADAARKRPELTGVTSLFNPSVPQVFARVDRDKVLKLGVDIRDVYSALQTLMGGFYVNDFNRFGRQWKVYLQADPEYRIHAEGIGQFFVRNNNSEMVPLSTLVSIEPTAGPEFTTHFNLYRSSEIIGAAAPGYTSGQAMDALEEVFHQVMPPEMGYTWSNLSFQQKRAEGGAAGVFALSLLFVFLILAALYESWSLPFSVLLGTPVAVLGAFLGLWMRQFENNVYAQIGLVMLIGLAAKNAILIVEFAKLERERGKSAVQAALSGARLRLRPILMTSFAFILGCMPLWVAAGAGSVARQILGTVVIAGMLAATLIGIFVVPVLFVVVEKIAHRKESVQVPRKPAAVVVMEEVAD
ncbi:MAG TPA: multidrug efflux RND transporter permease subunit [Candidatus Binatia bacterium]|nr:multidrug efflux RND transporter permease subunit [Candidatus Binatia bacterium]